LLALCPQVATGGRLSPHLPGRIAEHLATTTLGAHPGLAATLGQAVSDTDARRH
jgi:hypothetical protein